MRAVIKPWISSSRRKPTRSGNSEDRTIPFASGGNVDGASRGVGSICARDQRVRNVGIRVIWNHTANHPILNDEKTYLLNGFDEFFDGGSEPPFQSPPPVVGEPSNVSTTVRRSHHNVLGGLGLRIRHVVRGHDRIVISMEAEVRNSNFLEIGVRTRTTVIVPGVFVATDEIYQ